MQPLIPDAGFFPTLVFDPDPDNARTIAAQLAGQRVSVRVVHSAEEALQSASRMYFRVLFVVADLNNKACLRFLNELHRTTPRSWLIVSNAHADKTLESIVYRHGGDALVKSPVDIHDLVERISCFQARSRPLS
jgi:DNA-binding response OmpR family regulator